MESFCLLKLKFLDDQFQRIFRRTRAREKEKNKLRHRYRALVICKGNAL